MAAHNRCVFSQNQIKRTLSHPAAISSVAGLLDGGEFIHLTELAEFLCEEWRFEDARCDLQLGGCVKALRELEAAGHFTLPWRKPGPGRAHPGGCLRPRPIQWACQPRREKFAAWH